KQRWWVTSRSEAEIEDPFGMPKVLPTLRLTFVILILEVDCPGNDDKMRVKCPRWSPERNSRSLKSNFLSVSFIKRKENSMGWGKTLLLGNIGNRIDMDTLEEDIANLRQWAEGNFREDVAQTEKIRKLVVENNELKLYFIAIIRLLIAKGAISQEEIKAIVEAIDAEDGSVDGRYSGKIC
ncbi:MAG: hypothetical protein JXA11_09805, partial [Phycisphaerae bacterium]|nr:hypothetical protein [Phycisphaerae bacterium]